MDVLVRVKNARKLPVLRRYPDQSCVSLLGASQVRVIDCGIAISARVGRCSQDQLQSHHSVTSSCPADLDSHRQSLTVRPGS